MHALVLFAIFAFALGLGLDGRCPAGRSRPALVLAAGAAWPTTLLGGPARSRRGGAPARGVPAPARRARPADGAAPARSPPARCSCWQRLAASAAPAVTQSGVVDWQRWNPYTTGRAGQRRLRLARASTAASTSRAGRRPSSRYRRRRRPRYWRATTLDRFDERRLGRGAQPSTSRDPEGGRELLTRDETLPRARRRLRRWVRQRFFDRARSPTTTCPPPRRRSRTRRATRRSCTRTAAWRSRRSACTRATLHGLELRAASRSRKRSPALGADYPAAALERYLEVSAAIDACRRSARPGGTRALRTLFAADPAARSYRPLYRTARRVVGNARDAVRRRRRARGVVPYEPAASPTTSSRRRRTACRRSSTSSRRRTSGYCQHFAGAMALMLRYLGVPARVAAGFTSGTYDAAASALDRHRPRRARLGRGLVPRLRLAAVRPDAVARAARRGRTRPPRRRSTRAPLLRRSRAAPRGRLSGAARARSAARARRGRSAPPRHAGGGSRAGGGAAPRTGRGRAAAARARCAAALAPASSRQALVRRRPLPARATRAGSPAPAAASSPSSSPTSASRSRAARRRHEARPRSSATARRRRAGRSRRRSRPHASARRPARRRRGARRGASSPRSARSLRSGCRARSAARARLRCARSASLVDPRRGRHGRRRGHAGSGR